MKTLNRILISSTLLAVVAIGCKPDPSDAPIPGIVAVDKTVDMVVPTGFDYRTSDRIAYNFNLVNSPIAGKYRADIYDFLPLGGGRLIQSVFIAPNGSLDGEVELPTSRNEMYVVLVAPDGSSTTHKIQASSNVNYTFNASGKKSTKGKAATVSPDCNSGCAVSYTNQGGNININSNDPGGVYCFSGNTTASINVNRGGVTIRICGTANINNLNLNQGSGLEVTDGSSLTVSNLGVNSSSANVTIYQNATLTDNNGLSLQGTVINHGTIDVDDNLNLNSNTNFTNNGLTKVGIDLNVNTTTVVNNGTIEVGDDYHANGGSNTTNNCKLLIDDDLHVNSTITNNSYIYMEDQLIVNGGSNLTLAGGAMIEANRATINATVTGTGSTNLIKLFDSSIFGNSLQTTINGGAGFSGNIEYCDPNGIETNNGSFSNGAAEGCDAYIATSACNPSGNGTPQITDTDSDGVADENDAYPNDPARAANSYYPAIGQFATVAYEDLWPAYGDYDFNDLVMDYNIQLVLNANNQVVDIIGKFSTQAVGGSFTNGFGIQFDFAPSVVSSVTGTLPLTENFINLSANGTEAGQTKATIIVYDKADNQLPNAGTAFVNTETGDPYVAPDTATVTIALGTPQALNALGNAPYNPFMIVNRDRGREVHLPGFAPTDLVNNSFFGTADDDTQGSKFYQSTTNLPWAINIITGFEYPTEKVDIVQAYTNFSTWAQSNGSQFENWYEDLPGYRVDQNIY